MNDTETEIIIPPYSKSVENTYQVRLNCSYICSPDYFLKSSYISVYKIESTPLLVNIINGHR